MTIFIDGHSFGYELQRVAQLFYFGEKIITQSGAPDAQTQGNWAHLRLIGNQLELHTRLSGQTAAGLRQRSPEGAFSFEKPLSGFARDTAAPDDAPQTIERKFASLFYSVLSAHTGLRPVWGVLTGIRPVKLFLRALTAGADEAALRRHFLEERLLDESRFLLAMQTAQVERPLLKRSTDDSFSLYLSIPFCPTRCDYCSFVSHSIARAAALIPDYLRCLEQELEETGRIAKELGLRLRTVYFGGGTPTTLSADQLARLLEKVSQAFDLSELWEYTVEAGRPDTVTAEKLRVLREWGVDRVSINPQTMSDSVLEAIGRRHTTAQTMQAYALAQNMGFRAINMDLIAGLPTDTPEGFRASVEGALALAPENLTVHTLTVKRAAGMTFDRACDALQTAGEMVDDARQRTVAAGYRPYYLYRQNGSLSALENVGYALPGTEGLYNIYIMDETHSIFAVGAGGSTKLVRAANGGMRRCYNHKYPYEYINRFDEVLARKQEIRTFYQSDGL